MFMMRSCVGLMGAAKFDSESCVWCIDCISLNLFFANFNRALLIESFLLDNDDLSLI